MDYQVTTIKNITIMPSNIFFREFAANLAASQGSLVISDCTEVWEENGAVSARKPSVDGKNFTMYHLDPELSYILLMRSMDGAQEFIESAAGSPANESATASAAGSPANVQHYSKDDLVLSDGLEVLEIHESTSEIRDIKDAELIFSGGRGIMNEESFDALRKLAGKYDAAVGASRPMVDQGWAAWEEQVGQTGSIVKPKVYVAFGISGAVQHITGIEKSQNIIAVNLNKASPIFRYANYGAYSDDNSIIRNMINIIEEMKGDVK